MEKHKNELVLLKNDILQAVKDEGRNTRDFVMQQINAVKIETRQDMRVMKKEIVDEITEFIGDSILPQIDDHEHRLVKLETKTL